MLEIVRLEVHVADAGHGRGVRLRLSSVKHIVDAKANVVDLGMPRDGHVLGEEPGISASLRKEINHVLNKRPTEPIVVLVSGLLVEELVVEARGGRLREEVLLGAGCDTDP